MTRTARVFIALLAVAVVGLGVLALQQFRRAEQAEEQLGLDAGRVLSAVFTQARELRVARLTGKVLARSSHDGYLFDPEQRTRAPFAVNYFVDLKSLGQDDYDWNARRKVMTVRIPDVTIEAPSIDMSRAEVTQRGFWVSRKAGVELQRKGFVTLRGTATTRANSDENLRKARAAAVSAVTAYLREPLRAAELGDVTVEVRFRWEGRRSPEQWDRSRRPEDVLRDTA
jgi:hypothetical protein